MFTNAQQESLKSMMAFCSAVSLVASSIIVLKYLCFPKIRSRSFKLVVWLCISNLGLNAAVICALSNTYPSTSLNTFFAFLVNYFILSSVFWSMTVTKTMSMVILQRNKLLAMLSNNAIEPQKLAVKRMIKFHLIVLVSSFVLSIIPVATDSLKDFTYSWYWYKSDRTSQIVAIVCYYGPLTVGEFCLL